MSEIPKETHAQIEVLRKLAFDMAPDAQYRLASFVAENVGYVLQREGDHPDSPHGDAPQAPLPELDEDDPVVLAVARGIAEHGFARHWDDFLPLNVHDTDQSDLIDYAKAAIASMPVAPPVRSAASTVEPVPFAWVLPGDDTARDNGFIDARIDREGEFTKPLYAASTTSPEPDAVRDLRERGAMTQSGIRCEACYGIGLTDNHVTGEIECSACGGTGWDVLPVVDTGDELHQILGAALPGKHGTDGAA